MPARRSVRGHLARAAAIATLFGAGYAAAAVPHMLNALNDLQNAQLELRMAGPNPSGYRQRALQLVAQAILEVQQGMAGSRRP